MRILFVTGTDTGVGKTFVTACCLAHLLRSGKRAQALKPFCSGERTDALVLWELQERKLPLDAVNPFYFQRPLAPWTAARAEGKSVRVKEAVAALNAERRDCDILLIEGAGGVLSPLGEGFNAADLIARLECEVIVVAANRLGVLNQTLLTVEALERRGVSNIKLALIDLNSSDSATETNEADLRSLLPRWPLVRLPFLPNYRAEPSFFYDASRQLHRELALLVD